MAQSGREARAIELIGAVRAHIVIKKVWQTGSVRHAAWYGKPSIHGAATGAEKRMKVTAAESARCWKRP